MTFLQIASGTLVIAGCVVLFATSWIWVGLALIVIGLLSLVGFHEEAPSATIQPEPAPVTLPPEWEDAMNAPPLPLTILWPSGPLT